MAHSTGTEGGVVVAFGRKEGEAFVEVHADTSPFVPEAERGIRAGAETVERDLKKTGDNWGETLADAMGNRLEKEGSTFSKSVEHALGKETVKATVKADIEPDRNTGRRFVARLGNDIERAAREVAGGGAGGGGIFGKIGTAFADAIGAGFNISGKSPLIAFLVPLVGAIVGLVVAALQAVSALIASLTLLPALLASIGIQVGVLFLAFDNLGTAIQGAFAAKNAKELQKALSTLAPEAQNFVRELLPLRSLFHDIQMNVQNNFFREIRGMITELAKFQGGRIMAGLEQVASAMGRLFHDIGFFFNSDAFTTFLNEIFPRIVDFLDSFNLGFGKLLIGLTELANAAMPFLTEFGHMITGALGRMGDFFKELAADPTFPKFLEDMASTISELIDLFRVVGVFVGVFMEELNRAGGQRVIEELKNAIGLLAAFLATEAGQKALEAIVHLAIIGIQSFTGMVIAILFVLGSLEAFAEYMKNEFLGDVGGVLGKIGEFFSWLGSHITGVLFGTAVVILNFFVTIWKSITEFISNSMARFSAFGTSVRTFFFSLPDRIKEAFASAGTWLYNAGRNLIQGLINGVKSMFAAIGNVMSMVGQKISDFIPHSPAKEGPLSGDGDPMLAGQKLVRRLGEGMEMAIPALKMSTEHVTTNIMFGRGAIVQNFAGLPGQEQARGIGNGVAVGIGAGLTAQNVRLAVRTL